MSKGTAKIVYIEFLAGVLALLVAGIAQALLLIGTGTGHTQETLLYGSILVFVAAPLFAIWFPVFCNQPLLPIQVYIRWCLWVSCWVCGTSTLFEFLIMTGFLPVHNQEFLLFGRLSMLVGWFSFVPHLHLRFLERKPNKP